MSRSNILHFSKQVICNLMSYHKDVKRPFTGESHLKICGQYKLYHCMLVETCKHYRQEQKLKRSRKIMKYFIQFSFVFLIVLYFAVHTFTQYSCIRICLMWEQLVTHAQNLMCLWFSFCLSFPSID